MATSLTWIGAALFLVFFLLVITSSWLRGSIWFRVIIGSLAASLLAFAPRAWSSASNWETLQLSLFGLALFLVFFYVVSGRYLTQTDITDLKYQSYEALSRFISDAKILSPLARVVRWLMPMCGVVLALLVLASFFGTAGVVGTL